MNQSLLDYKGKTTNENNIKEIETIINPKVFGLMVGFVTLLILSNGLFYFGIFAQKTIALLLTSFFYQLSRITCEMFIMFISSLFGKTITCKSIVL